MASSPLGELEDLTLCSYCRRAFDEGEQQPKVLSCKHHFCLKCVNSVLLKGRELYCLHCWKRTELPDARADSLPTHGALVALARRLAAGSLPPAPPTTAADECTAHGLPVTLWCTGCEMSLCRGCPGHVGHAVQPAAEARATLRRDIARDLHQTHRLLDDLQRLVFRQRDFLLKILEACTTLKTQLETELVNNPAGFELSDAREALESARRALAADSRPPELRSMLTGLATERERLQARHRDMFLQCRLDDLIRGARVALDFELLKRALADAHSAEPPPPDDGYRNPVLFLANYCMSQLYSRHCLMKRHDILAQNGDLQHSLSTFVPFQYTSGKQPYDVHLKSNFVEFTNNNIALSKPSPLGFGDNGPMSPANKTSAFQTDVLSLALPSINSHSPQPILRNPTSHVFPLFYFNIEVNGTPFGRIVIEVRSDVAPRMARNFSVLTTGEYGIGYKGCSVFQCWENESVITGDFELNNGRGGRSVFEESYFMPDDTKMVAVRGSVGMRRSQKRHDNLGLVGSQFRVILREMRGFTGIFAYVAEGLELVDRLSQTGDSAGKPQSSILIASCGKLN